MPGETRTTAAALFATSAFRVAEPEAAAVEPEEPEAAAPEEEADVELVVEELLIASLKLG